MNFLIINGPNLNLLGRREPEYYGNKPFEEVLSSLRMLYPDHQIDYFQSNVEGELINQLQAAGGTYDGVILNAGGYTHTSVAIGDTVGAIDVPVVEVHISNVMGRESFRQLSYIAPNAKGVISGFGTNGYRLALEAFLPS